MSMNKVTGSDRCEYITISRESCQK